MHEDEYINENSAYLGVSIPIGIVPTLLALIPLLYHIPTVYVTCNVISVYYESVVWKKDHTSLNRNVVLIIVLHQASVTCLLISDYANFRIPATGVLTAWCASQPPSKLLNTVFWSSIYFYYLVMLFPFLLALLRLIPVYYPMKHVQISSTILKVSIPLVVIYPFVMTSFLIPARGVCRQYEPPYSFGAIYFHFINSWNDMKNAIPLMLNLTFWLTMCFIINLILFLKLEKLRSSSQNSKSFQKAEKSLTLSSISMLISFAANIVFLATIEYSTEYAKYAISVRSFASDFDAVIVVWIVFLIHPAFKKKSESLKKFLTAKRIAPQNSDPQS